MRITDEMLFEYAPKARDLWLSTLPEDTEIPEFQCSRVFERKMQRIIKSQQHTQKTNRTLRYIRQTVAAILAIAIISVCGLMTVKAYREKIVEIVVHIFNELTDYRFISEKSDEDGLPLPKVSFGQVPEGMVEVENQITGNKRRRIVYENSAGLFFELTQRHIGADGKYGSILDTENAEGLSLTINGNEAYSNEKDGNSSIVWIENDIVYNLYGNIELDMLKAIAEKIEIFKD